MTEEERKDAIEHRDILLDIRAILATRSGRQFIKYLFKHLGVGEMPELGLENNILMDKLGFLRSGNSIFKLISEASTVDAGNILAEVEKERHARIYNESREASSDDDYPSST